MNRYAVKVTVTLSLLSILAIVLPATVSAQTNRLYSIHAPGNTTRCDIRADKGAGLQYRVSWQGKPVTAWSDLGLMIDTGDHNPVTIAKTSGAVAHHEKFAWPLGEDDTVDSHYIEDTIACTTASLRFNCIIRVFDGSIAFRYAIPPQPAPAGKRIRKENTQFNFPGPYTIYRYNQESVFTPVRIDTMSHSCDFPATLTNGKYYISIGEADNQDYTKAELKKAALPYGLSVAFVRDSAVSFTGAYETPWRTISIAASAIGLHDYSQLYLKLLSPASPQVPQWIKPGKLIRAQLTTQSGIDCIDFAAAHHFQYILFDAGWYGAEFRSVSDPTQSIPAIDMPRVLQYGREKGIGVILYVNYVGLKAKLDTLLPLYKKWGVSGLKFGFVDGLTQHGIAWLAQAIRKVNDAGLVLDVHDNYKPTGLSRRYPALLTQEGIRGDENSPDAFHTTVLPFTRFLAGPADFTFCYPNPKNDFSKNLKVSKAQQLALTVIYFSPLQSICWYGKPLDYTNESEIEFFKFVPTVWNESKYLSGAIGRYISVARRHGDTWFIGNAAGPDDWKENISLSFLTAGKNYQATLYEDDGNSGIRKKMFTARKNDRFTIALKAKGGQALMLEPIEKPVIRPGDVWPDKNGNHIQAHGGGIIKIGKYYYWYGEERAKGLDTNYRFVSGYMSDDLVNWTFLGDVLKLSDPENLGHRWVLERPKVFYNKAAGNYVMYFHLDDRTYKFARVGVAVSKKPEGPFTYVKSFRPLNYESRDIGQFIDDDGTPYLIFESRPSKGFYIAGLSTDYMDVVKEVSFIHAPLEGGAVVHYKGLYYAIGSALTGWRPNPNKYATAATLAGPWSEFKDIAPPETNTYGSQSTMLLKVEGAKATTIIFMADQWRPATQWDSRYLWMPVEIGEGRLWVPQPAPWTIDIKTGEWKPVAHMEQ